MSRIGAAFISDRGDLYLPDCLKSFHERVFEHDMTYTIVDDREHRLGMAGAVRQAWDWAIQQDLDYLFHVEEDFRFAWPLSVENMICVLNEDPTLAQVVLKRQPWSPEEHHAGGIIECHPADYQSFVCGGLRWVSHQRIFSLNPCVIPRHILELGWPDGNEAEMTTNLVSLGYRFAFYGAKDDPPRVIHVGVERAAGWRL